LVHLNYLFWPIFWLEVSAGWPIETNPRVAYGFMILFLQNRDPSLNDFNHVPLFTHWKKQMLAFVTFLRCLTSSIYQIHAENTNWKPKKEKESFGNYTLFIHSRLAPYGDTKDHQYVFGVYHFDFLARNPHILDRWVLIIEFILCSWKFVFEIFINRSGATWKPAREVYSNTFLDCWVALSGNWKFAICYPPELSWSISAQGAYTHLFTYNILHPATAQQDEIWSVEWPNGELAGRIRTHPPPPHTRSYSWPWTLSGLSCSYPDPDYNDLSQWNAVLTLQLTVIRFSWASRPSGQVSGARPSRLHR
jgi:hypothetical protein